MFFRRQPTETTAKCHLSKSKKLKLPANIVSEYCDNSYLVLWPRQNCNYQIGLIFSTSAPKTGRGVKIDWSDEEGIALPQLLAKSGLLGHDFLLEYDGGLNMWFLDLSKEIDG